MNGNEIPDLLSLEKELGSLSSLTTIYLEANPCQLNDMSAYRRKVMLALPQLKQIDATWVQLYAFKRRRANRYWLGIRDKCKMWTMHSFLYQSSCTVIIPDFCWKSTAEYCYKRLTSHSIPDGPKIKPTLAQLEERETVMDN